MSEQEINFRFKLKYAHAVWIEQILNGRFDNQIWNGYLVSFMFNHIPGSFDHKCSVMTNEIERVYNTLGRHVVHEFRSKSQREKLPRLYAFPDYPRQKLEPFDWKDINCNDGLHYHGIILIRIDTKLKTGLDMFIMREDNYRRLVKFGGPLRRIHIEPVDRTPETPLNMPSKRLSGEFRITKTLLILPKSPSELPDKHMRAYLDAKPWGA